MTQVSRRFIKKDLEQKINSLLHEAVSSVQSSTESAQFLDDLLTPTEKIVLAKRLAIAYLLLKGYPYAAIESTLKVSNSTVSFVALMLKYKSEGLRKVINKLIKQKELKNLFEDIGIAIIGIIGSAPGSDWKTTKSIVHQHTLDKQSPL